MMAVTGGEKPTSIDELKPKMALTGVVKKVELFGAFVDVGVGQDGLLHISQLSSGHVRNVTDVVNEGDEVNVFVMQVDREKRRFNLTMVRPAELEWGEIKPGVELTGKVVRVEKFGAFVDVGAERPGRIHVSELSTEYVKDPEDVVKVGDEVKVKVLDVNRRKHQIDLSIKALQDSTQSVAAVEYADEETDAYVATAMELALRAAMEGTELEQDLPRRRGKKRRRNNDRSQQEDIIARTLQHRKS